MPVPKWVYEELEKITFEFLWGGRNKINKNTMYLDYHLGGLKMMNFELIIKAQRVMWVKKLLENNEMKWKLYFNHATQHVGGSFIFSCDYLLGLLNLTLPKFYTDLLEVWIETRNFQQNYEPYKGNEIMFNNKFIRVNGKCIFDRKLFDKKVYRLNHIMDSDGKLRSLGYFQRRGLESNDVELIGKIYDTLPVSWKRNMRTDRDTIPDDPDIVFLLGKNVVAINNIASKKIYTTFLNQKAITPGVFTRLKCNYRLSDKDIENIFKRPRQCTLNSRLREFQFKLIHGIIYTNQHLYLFGKVDSNLCSYCKREEETYRHLFFQCGKAKLIWRDCENIFDFVSFTNLTWEDIFWGIKLADQGKEKLVNHLIILVKYLVFSGREKKSEIVLNKIKRKFKEDEFEERKLALNRNKYPLHLRKWECWEEFRES